MNETLKTLIEYLIVFAVGGTFCAIAQLMIIKTKLTPARILVIFLIIGIILEGLGAYQHIYGFAKAGISVPIIGFGASLARGAILWTGKVGFLGAFAGGIIHTAFGVGAAIIASYAVTLVFSPKTK